VDCPGSGVECALDDGGMREGQDCMGVREEVREVRGERDER
jgi:hypothetical protein